MDKQEARFILMSYRPDGRDAGDPAFAEALETMRSDPDFTAWFEQARAFDETVGTKLRESPVPLDLKKAILAGMKSQQTVDAASQRVVRPGLVWWRSPALAWAAVIAFIFIAAALLHDSGKPFPNLALADYRQEMVGHLSNGFSFDLRSDEPVQIQNWLAQKEGVEILSMPDALKQSKSIGCKTFEVGGLKSALVCFSLSDGNVVHLFLMDCRAFDHVELTDQLSFARQGSYTTAAWRQEGMSYLLVAELDEDAIRELVPIASAAGRSQD